MQKTKNSLKYLALLAWLRQTRLNKNLSMRDLAAKIGEPHSFIGKVETGERRLDVYEYMQYCRVLEVNPVDGLKFLD